MKDRIPKHPGRIKLTPVDGDIYDLERADEPEQEGTPINKATLLTDETAKLLEIKKENPTPNDAFEHIAKNAVGDEGMNINLLEGLGNMKYCKVLTTETPPDVNSAWMSEGAMRYVLRKDDLNYTLLLKIPENSRNVLLKCIKADGSENSLAIPVNSDLFDTSRSPTTDGYVEVHAFLHAEAAGKRYAVIYCSYCQIVDASNSYRAFASRVFIYDTETNSLLGTRTPSSESGQNCVSDVRWYFTYRYAINAYHNKTYNGIYFTVCERNVYVNNATSLRAVVFNLNTLTFTNVQTMANHASDSAMCMEFFDDNRFLWGYSYPGDLYTTGYSCLNICTLTGISSHSDKTLWNRSGNDSLNYLMRSRKNNTIPVSVDVFTSPNDPCVFRNITANTTTVTPEAISGISLNDVFLFNQNGLFSIQSLTPTTAVIFNAETATYTETINPKYNNNYSIRLTQPQYKTAKPFSNMVMSQTYCDTESPNNTILVVDRYGNFADIKLDRSEATTGIWVCPEDGIYKFILVGGGAAGADTYGGGSGYLKIVAKNCVKGEQIPYTIGLGGCYSAQSIHDTFKPVLTATYTKLGDEIALGGIANIGGANGSPSLNGGGGGGYDLVNYGGAGGNSSAAPTINGGRGSQPAAGYGAGGSSCANGRDGCIVVIR